MEESPAWWLDDIALSLCLWGRTQHPHLCRRVHLVEADRFEEGAVYFLMK